MSDINEIKKAWATLNDYETESARKNEIRDGNRVDHKDQVLNVLDSTEFMVQTMTGRLDRVEQRLNILYWIGLELLSLKELIGGAVLIGGVFGIAAVIYKLAARFF